MAGINWNDPAFSPKAFQGLVEEYNESAIKYPYEIVLPKRNTPFTFVEVVDPTMKVAAPITAQGATIQTIDIQRSKKQFTCGIVAITVPINGLDRALAPIDLADEAVSEIMSMVRRSIEAEFENQFVKNCSITVEGEAWDDDSKNPLKHIIEAKKAIKKACGVAPNVLIAKPDVLAALEENNNVKDYIRYLEPSAVDNNGEIKKLKGLTLVEAPDSILDLKGKEISKFADDEAYLAYMSNKPKQGLGFLACAKTRTELGPGAKKLVDQNLDTPLIFKTIDDMTVGGTLKITGELGFFPVIHNPKCIAKITGVL
jgi:hypothetical protein